MKITFGAVVTDHNDIDFAKLGRCFIIKSIHLLGFAIRRYSIFKTFYFSLKRYNIKRGKYFSVTL